MSVGDQLGLDDNSELLDQARQKWPAWVAADPRLGVVDEVRRPPLLAAVGGPRQPPTRSSWRWPCWRPPTAATTSPLRPRSPSACCPAPAGSPAG